MSYGGILDCVQQYYSEKVRTYGPTARGADWNSRESQDLRFAQLLKVIDDCGQFTINDYGCGYGALVNYLRGERYSFRYFGFDISERMMINARELHASSSQAAFVDRESELSQADYTVASGVFNVRLQTSAADWEPYMFDCIEKINRISRRGFAFNALSKYSDPEFRRPDLYYGDPLLLFDYCKKRFSRFVSLLHDYPLFEFTILVKKER